MLILQDLTYLILNCIYIWSSYLFLKLLAKGEFGNDSHHISAEERGRTAGAMAKKSSWRKQGCHFCRSLSSLSDSWFSLVTWVDYRPFFNSARNYWMFINFNYFVLYMGVHATKYRLQMLFVHPNGCLKKKVFADTCTEAYFLFTVRSSYLEVQNSTHRMSPIFLNKPYRSIQSPFFYPTLHRVSTSWISHWMDVLIEEIICW